MIRSMLYISRLWRSMSSESSRTYFFLKINIMWLLAVKCFRLGVPDFHMLLIWIKWILQNVVYFLFNSFNPFTKFLKNTDFILGAIRTELRTKLSIWVHSLDRWVELNKSFFHFELPLRVFIVSENLLSFLQTFVPNSI